MPLARGEFEHTEDFAPRLQGDGQIRDDAEPFSGAGPHEVWFGPHVRDGSHLAGLGEVDADLAFNDPTDYCGNA